MTLLLERIKDKALAKPPVVAASRLGEDTHRPPFYPPHRALLCSLVSPLGGEPPKCLASHTLGNVILSKLNPSGYSLIKLDSSCVDGRNSDTF